MGGTIVKRLPITLGMVLIFFSSFCLLPAELPAADCFSDSYSIRKGRGLLEDLVTRELSESEVQDLETLLKSLEGDWKGSAEVVTCNAGQKNKDSEIENFTVESEGKMNSRGGPPIIAREWMVAIRKTGDSGVSIEKSFHLQGLPISTSVWHLETD